MTEPEIQTLHEVARDVKDIRKLLFGNGRPGICDRVTITEQAVRQIQEAHGPERSGNWIALAAVMVALISLFVTLSGS